MAMMLSDERKLLPEIPNKPTLRIDETMAVLSCSDEHVRHLIEEGSLEAIDVRSAITHKPSFRIVRESLVGFIQKRKTIP